MKQASAEKYSIAWFKLAEYVARGEKERALGVYRLLSHSIDDQAFARQLEGDILWCFNDIVAHEKYYQAAQLYQKNNRLVEAILLYESLLGSSDDSLFLRELVELYRLTGEYDKEQSCLKKLQTLNPESQATIKTSSIS